MGRPPNPKTDEEWQAAVDGADACLWLDSARQYGLVTGGPTVKVRRCEEILKKGRARGIRPSPGNVVRVVAAINAERRDDAPPQ